MARKALIVILGCIVILGGVVYYKARSPLFWEWAAERYMKDRYDGIQVDQVKIGRVLWSAGPSVGFEDVRMHLSVDKRDFLGQMQGTLKGRVHIQWPGKVTALGAAFDAPQGGEIKADLLIYLAQYIPQRQDLEDLIKGNKALFLDNAFLELNLLSSDRLTSHIKISALKLNLNVNVSMDVNIEGGVEALLKRINSSLKE